MADCSYVISVSIRKGCYRHIQVPDSYTLFQLHQEILDAFDFEVDESHAFFFNHEMENGSHDFYSPNAGEKGSSTTEDVRLNQLHLHEKQRFEYCFNLHVT